jgi:hypothetical protein
MSKNHLTNSRFFTLYIICLLLFFSSTVNALEDKKLKAKVTTAFIYQITKFTQWPNQTPSANNHFNLCLLGSIDKNLRNSFEILTTKKINKRLIKIVAFDKAEQLLLKMKSKETFCHLIFSSQGWQVIPEVIINQLHKKALLISNSTASLMEGGMIALVVFNKKMTIFINPHNLSQSPIKLESRLKALTKVWKEAK